MIYLDLMNYIFGVEVRQQKQNIFISQKTYIETLPTKFKMYSGKFVATSLVTKEKLQKDY